MKPPSVKSSRSNKIQSIDKTFRIAHLSLCLTARRMQSQVVQRQWKYTELEPISWNLIEKKPKVIFLGVKFQDQVFLHLEEKLHQINIIIPNTRIESSKPVLFVALSSSFEIVNNPRKRGFYSLHSWPSGISNACAVDRWTKTKINKSFSHLFLDIYQ